MESVWEIIPSILIVLGYIVGGLVVLALTALVIYFGIAMSPMLLDEKKKLSRARTLFISGPALTLVGWPLLLGLIQILFWVINWLIDSDYLGHNTTTVIAGLFLSISYFYIGGLAKVKKANVGMPEVFGARLTGFVLPEGYSHIPPRPFMSYTETPIELITTKLNEPMEVLVGKQPEQAQGQPQQVPGTDNVSQVKMKVDASIAWQADPLYLLGYTSVQDGVRGVEKALVDIMRRVIREKAQGMSDSEFLKGQEKLEKALRDALEASTDEQELRKEEDYQDTQAKKEEWVKIISEPTWHNLIKRLGITIIKIQATKIVPASQEMIDRLERIRGEQIDKDNETKQMKHVVENLMGPLMAVKVSPEMALRAALTTTKDAKMIIVDGGAGDFTKGQAIAATLGKGGE